MLAMVYLDTDSDNNNENASTLSNVELLSIVTIITNSNEDWMKILKESTKTSIVIVHKKVLFETCQ